MAVVTSHSFSSCAIFLSVILIQYAKRNSGYPAPSWLESRSSAILAVLIPTDDHAIRKAYPQATSTQLPVQLTFAPDDTHKVALFGYDLKTERRLARPALQYLGYHCREGHQPGRHPNLHRRTQWTSLDIPLAGRLRPVLSPSPSPHHDLYQRRSRLPRPGQVHAPVRQHLPRPHRTAVR